MGARPSKPRPNACWCNSSSVRFSSGVIRASWPAQALKEYETSLRTARNRFRGFYGAAKAADQAGNRAKAKDYYEKLVALCSHSAGERRELAEAKTYLAGK